MVASKKPLFKRLSLRTRAVNALGHNAPDILARLQTEYGELNYTEFEETMRSALSSAKKLSPERREAYLRGALRNCVTTPSARPPFEMLAKRLGRQVAYDKMCALQDLLSARWPNKPDRVTDRVELIMEKAADADTIKLPLKYIDSIIKDEKAKRKSKKGG
jgi:hypothetical protein